MGIEKEREEGEERGQKDQLKHPLRPTYKVKDRERTQIQEDACLAKRSEKRISK